MPASIDDIIDRLGGPEAAARLTGVSTEAVRKWRQAGAVPSRHWAAVSAATGLPMDELRGEIPAQTGDTPPGATAALVLADGAVFWGRGFGAHTGATPPVAELCFNTSMTGYQETLTDPSYAGQIITFTFPHIGNVGTNPEDIEAGSIAARGLIVKQDITEPANWRSTQHLDTWLRARGISGIAGVDTRALTSRIRDGGPPTGVICFPADGKFDLDALRAQAEAWPGLEGMDLAKEVTCAQSYGWDESSYVGRRATAGRTCRSAMSWRWISGRSATFCAAWPPPAAR
jgi:carbamoyl-phosphate synthase small subunit